MKKITSLMISGFFGLSIMAGCASETSNLLVPQQTTQNTTGVSTYSRAGLNSAFTVLLKAYFTKADANKDKYVSLAEYKAAVAPSPAPNPPSPDPVPTASADPVAPPADAPPAPPATTAEEVSSDAQQAQIPADPTARFSRMDKNKDGKLSFTEVTNNSKFFISLNKQALKSVAKGYFDQLNTDKNKAVSQAEFSKIGGEDYASKMNNSTMFYAADRDSNGTLSLSEFEDLVYSSLKASILAGPLTPPSVTPSATPTDAPVPVTPPSEDPVAPPSAPASDVPPATP